MPIVCILIGSNIDPAANTCQALKMLRCISKITAVSSTWETPAVGSTGPNFLNTALLLQTELPPGMLKNDVLKPLEEKLGRVRTSDRFAPRTIDLDIVTYGDEVIDLNLWERAFIAIPVAELLPDLRHPGTGRTLNQIAAALEKTSGAVRCNP